MVWTVCAGNLRKCIKKLYVENLTDMFWKAAIIPVHELVSNNNNNKSVADLLSRCGCQIVTVKCSPFFGSGSILRIANIDECLDTGFSSWNLTDLYFQWCFLWWEDWFGTRWNLQPSNKIASENIGAPVGVGSTSSWKRMQSSLVIWNCWMSF